MVYTVALYVSVHHKPEFCESS